MEANDNDEDFLPSTRLELRVCQLALADSLETGVGHHTSPHKAAGSPILRPESGECSYGFWRYGGYIRMSFPPYKLFGMKAFGGMKVLFLLDFLLEV